MLNRRSLRTSKILKYLSNFELSKKQIYACIFVGYFIMLHWIACVFYTLSVLQIEGNLVTRKFPWIIEKDLCPTQVGASDEMLSPFTSNSAEVFAKRGIPYAAENDWFSGSRGVNTTSLCRDIPKTTWVRYLTSFYWSVVTMATVGYGDFTASTNLEYAFVTVIAVVGTLISAGVMGFVSSQIAFESAKTTHADLGLLIMRKKLIASPLDSESKEKYLENVHAMMNYSIPEQLMVLRAFPQFYYEKLVQTLFLPHLNKCAIFEPVDLHAKELMCLRCKTFVCAAGQVILSQGSFDASLYIVMHGEVELLGVSQDSDDALQYALLHADDTAASAYFGEQVQIDHSMRWLYHLTRFRL